MTFFSWWEEGCFHVGWHLLLFGFVLPLKNANIELDALTPPKGWSNTCSNCCHLSAVLGFLSKPKQIEEIRWHANLRHLLFFLCHWALKQRATGLAGNKGWMSINVHTNTVKGFSHTDLQKAWPGTLTHLSKWHFHLQWCREHNSEKKRNTETKRRDEDKYKRRKSWIGIICTYLTS